MYVDATWENLSHNSIILGTKMDQAFWESDGKQKVMENVVNLGPLKNTIFRHLFHQRVKFGPPIPIIPTHEPKLGFAPNPSFGWKLHGKTLESFSKIKLT